MCAMMLACVAITAAAPLRRLHHATYPPRHISFSPSLTHSLSLSLSPSLSLPLPVCPTYPPLGYISCISHYSIISLTHTLSMSVLGTSPALLLSPTPLSLSFPLTSPLSCLFLSLSQTPQTWASLRLDSYYTNVSQIIPACRQFGGRSFQAL